MHGAHAEAVKRPVRLCVCACACVCVCVCVCVFGSATIPPNTGGVTLIHNKIFKYLGNSQPFNGFVLKNLDINKSAKHASRPFLASAYRVSRFVHEQVCYGRPHASLWLAKTYVIPAGTYSSQAELFLVLQAGQRVICASFAILFLFF